MPYVYPWWLRLMAHECILFNGKAPLQCDHGALPPKHELQKVQSWRDMLVNKAKCLILSYVSCTTKAKAACLNYTQLHPCTDSGLRKTKLFPNKQKGTKIYLNRSFHNLHDRSRKEKHKTTQNKSKKVHLAEVKAEKVFTRGVVLKVNIADRQYQFLPQSFCNWLRSLKHKYMAVNSILTIILM